MPKSCHLYTMMTIWWWGHDHANHGECRNTKNDVVDSNSAFDLIVKLGSEFSSYGSLRTMAKMACHITGSHWNKWDRGLRYIKGYLLGAPVSSSPVYVDFPAVRCKSKTIKWETVWEPCHCAQNFPRKAQMVGILCSLEKFNFQDKYSIQYEFSRLVIPMADTLTNRDLRGAYWKWNSNSTKESYTFLIYKLPWTKHSILTLSFLSF